MSRLAELFKRKNKKVLNVYCTAGFPQRDSTLDVIRSLHTSGVDLVELGMPYSDPLADGPVIQQSSARALANGMTIQLLFDQLKVLRLSPDQGGIGNEMPVVLMGYMNPVLQYGFERFCADAASVGIDGLILPDLPGFEFKAEYGPVIKKYGLDFIFLVTPETSEERIRELDELSSGFLYAVSSSSTTGSDKEMSPVEDYLARLNKMSLKNPILVGFGIKDKASFERAVAHAAGAIIGTAYIQQVEKSIKEAEQFIGSILDLKANS